MSRPPALDCQPRSKWSRIRVAASTHGEPALPHIHREFLWNQNSWVSCNCCVVFPEPKWAQTLRNSTQQQFLKKYLRQTTWNFWASSQILQTRFWENKTQKEICIQPKLMYKLTRVWEPLLFVSDWHVPEVTSFLPCCQAYVFTCHHLSQRSLPATENPNHIITSSFQKYWLGAWDKDGRVPAAVQARATAQQHDIKLNHLTPLPLYFLI